MFGVFAFAFIFCSAFVFADSVGPNVNYTKSFVRPTSSVFVFFVSDNMDVKNCSVFLTSKGVVTEFSSNETINNSKQNRIVVQNLSSGTNYSGEIRCFDGVGNIGKSKVFQFTTENANSSILSIFNSSGKINKQVLGNESINQSSSTNSSLNKSNLTSKFLIGASVGIVLVLFLFAIIFFFLKKFYRKR